MSYEQFPSDDDQLAAEEVKNWLRKPGIEISFIPRNGAWLLVPVWFITGIIDGLADAGTYYQHWGELRSRRYAYILLCVSIGAGLFMPDPGLRFVIILFLAGLIFELTLLDVLLTKFTFAFGSLIRLGVSAFFSGLILRLVWGLIL